MNSTRVIAALTIALSLALGACSSSPKSRPYAPTPMTSTAQVRQDYLKPGDVERVRTGEFVKTYHVGRTVAGRGGRTMHEAHRVYRLEKSNRWSLARDQPPLASTGPVNKVVDSAFTPAPRSKAIRAELQRQRGLTSQLEGTRDDLKGTIDAAKLRFADTAQGASVAASLRKRVERLEAENAALRSASPAVPEDAPNDPVPAADCLRKWGESLGEKAPEGGAPTKP